jgi:hypothetical protein
LRSGTTVDRQTGSMTNETAWLGSERQGGASDDAAAQPWLARGRQWLRRWSVPLRAGVTAVAAWVLTIAPLASLEAAALATKVSTAVALLAGVCAPALAERYPRLARHVGISLFVGACVSAWLGAAWLGALPPQGSVRAGLGAIAWALYGVSWVEVRRPLRSRSSPSASGPATVAHGLGPRRLVPAAVVLWSAASILVAVAFVLLAWRIGRTERAVLGHTLAAAAALAIVAIGARLALLAARLPEHMRGERAPLGIRRTTGAARWLALAVVLALAALALYVTRP